MTTGWRGPLLLGLMTGLKQLTETPRVGFIGGMLVTQMKESDLTEIKKLTEQLGYPSSLEQICNRFKVLNACANTRLLVAKDIDGRTVGYAAVSIELSLGNDPWVEVDGLVVDESRRGSGVGALLVADAEKWACEQGLNIVRLRSNISRNDAHRFYQKLGYELKKTSHLFIKNILREQKPPKGPS